VASRLEDKRKTGDLWHLDDEFSRLMAGAKWKEPERKAKLESENEVPSSHAFQLKTLKSKADLDDTSKPPTVS